MDMIYTKYKKTPNSKLSGKVDEGHPPTSFFCPQNYNNYSKLQRKSVKIFSFHAFCYYHERVSGRFLSNN